MRAIQTGNLAIIEATAAELGWVALRDALGILLVIEAKDDERFERSAVRWAGRLALEVPDLELAELAGALESLHALPDEHAQRTLLALAGRAVRPPACGGSPPARAQSAAGPAGLVVVTVIATAGRTATLRSTRCSCDGAARHRAARRSARC